MIEKNNYKVYVLAFPNGKFYVGCTGQQLERRWNYGFGYSENPEMFADIQKYGWTNIQKFLIKDGLTQRESYNLEQFFIQENKTYLKEFGYNRCIRQGRSSEEAKIIQSNPETKAKHGAVMEARWCDEEQRVILMEATQNAAVKAKRANTRKERKDMYEKKYQSKHPELFNKPVMDITAGLIYDSISQLVELNEMDKRDMNYIRQCCDRERNSFKNHHFKWADDDKYEIDRPVNIVDLYTGEIYQTSTQLAKELEVTPAAVCRHLNGQLSKLQGHKYEWYEPLELLTTDFSDYKDSVYYVANN